MRTLRIVLGAAMVAGLVGAGIAVAQEDQKQESAGPSSLPSPYVEAPSPEGFVVMEEEEWTITMADEPQKKLEDALDKLEAGDGKGAAHDLDKVAAHTKSAASRSDGYIKKLLLEAARQLNAQGEELRKGTGPPEEELRATFARDLQALARHHADAAGKQWLKGKKSAAGHDLMAAGLDLGYAVDWVDLEPDPRIEAAVSRAQEVAALLIEDAPVNPPPVMPTIEELQELIGLVEASLWPQTPSN